LRLPLSPPPLFLRMLKLWRMEVTLEEERTDWGNDGTLISLNSYSRRCSSGELGGLPLQQCGFKGSRLAPQVVPVHIRTFQFIFFYFFWKCAASLWVSFDELIGIVARSGRQRPQAERVIRRDESIDAGGARECRPRQCLFVSVGRGSGKTAPACEPWRGEAHICRGATAEKKPCHIDWDLSAS